MPVTRANLRAEGEEAWEGGESASERASERGRGVSVLYIKYIYKKAVIPPQRRTGTRSEGRVRARQGGKKNPRGERRTANRKRRSPKEGLKNKRARQLKRKTQR